MKTALRKIRQVTIGLMAILSLSVASVAACACSHHQAESEPKASCHSSSSHHKQKKATTTGHHISQSCECVLPATKLSVKGEGFKLKKHPTAAATTPKLESVSFYSIAPSTATPNESLVYVTSFYNSTAARGPPLS